MLHEASPQLSRGRNTSQPSSHRHGKVHNRLHRAIKNLWHGVAGEEVVAHVHLAHFHNALDFAARRTQLAVHLHRFITFGCDNIITGKKMDSSRPNPPTGLSPAKVQLVGHNHRAGQRKHRQLLLRSREFYHFPRPSPTYGGKPLNCSVVACNGQAKGSLVSGLLGL